jgi:hypothetical protein
MTFNEYKLNYKQINNAVNKFKLGSYKYYYDDKKWHHLMNLLVAYRKKMWYIYNCKP